MRDRQKRTGDRWEYSGTTAADYNRPKDPEYRKRICEGPARQAKAQESAAKNDHGKRACMSARQDACGASGLVVDPCVVKAQAFHVVEVLSEIILDCER